MYRDIRIYWKFRKYIVITEYYESNNIQCRETTLRINHNNGLVATKHSTRVTFPSVYSH